MRILKRILIAFVALSALCATYYFLSWTELPADRIDIKTTSISDSSYTKEIEASSKAVKELILNLNAPSVSVAVGIDGKIIWSEAVGYSNLSKKIPATPATAYRIGSTSKAVTSTAIMLLVQNGLLDIDQPVNNLLLNYPKTRWPFSTRHLLSHTAGIVHYENLSISGGLYTLFNFKQFNSVEEGLSVFKNENLLFEPGSQFKYSSFDVVLASSVIEQVTEKAFLVFLNENLFKPLNMENSYGDNGPYGGENEAVFYNTTKSKYRIWHTFGFPRNKINLSYKWAGGGLLSTPVDLVKMGNALVTDSAFVNNKIRNTFFTPQKLNNGKINEQRYVLGWRSYYDYGIDELLGTENIVWMVHHGGVSTGSMNLLCLFPNEKMVINVSINGREKDFDFTPFWIEVMKVASPFIKTLHSKE